MLWPRPPKKLQFGKSGGFVWPLRLPLLREHALSMGQEAVGAVYKNAPTFRGRGAT